MEHFEIASITLFTSFTSAGRCWLCLGVFQVLQHFCIQKTSLMWLQEEELGWEQLVTHRELIGFYCSAWQHFSARCASSSHYSRLFQHCSPFPGIPPAWLGPKIFNSMKYRSYLFLNTLNRGSATFLSPTLGLQGNPAGQGSSNCHLTKQQLNSGDSQATTAPWIT